MRNYFKTYFYIITLIIFTNIVNHTAFASNRKTATSDLSFRAEIATWYNNKNCAISLTFDDGTPNHFHITRPMMDNFGFKATFFVITKNVSNKVYGISWDTLRFISKLGHEVASHTVNHIYFNSANANIINNELRISKDTIIKNIPNQKYLTVAYPGAAYNDTVIRFTSGMYLAGRIGGGFEKKIPDNFALIKSNAGGENVSSWNALVDEAIRSKVWNVERFHGIDNDGWAPITSAVFKEHLQYIKNNESKIWVATFRDVVKYIKERINTELKVIKYTDTTITYKLITALDTSVYNIPVTVNVINYFSFDSVNVLVNKKPYPFSFDSKTISFNIIPSNQTVELTALCKQNVKGCRNFKDSQDFTITTFPNPFIEEIVIKYEVKKGYDSTIEVLLYNYMGTQVATIVNERQTAGTYVVKYNTSKLKPASYFLVIKSTESITKTPLMKIQNN